MTPQIIYDALLSKVEHSKKQRIVIGDVALQDVNLSLQKISQGITLTESEKKRVLSQLEYTFKKELMSTSINTLNIQLEKKVREGKKYTKTDIALYYYLSI